MKEKNKTYMESNRFSRMDNKFHDYISELMEMNVPQIDLIHQFPVFTGHVNIARYLLFYDLYMQCYKYAGNIADVGTWKGASFMFLSKLVRIFENNSYTQVHGFDWFKGMSPRKNDDINQKNKYKSDYETLLKLIELQELEDIAMLHKMDLTKELGKFFDVNKHMRFKLVFIDCGIENVLKESLKYFYPRLVKGGILIMDHFNLSVSPTESKLIEKYAGNNFIRQKEFSRQPTAYIIKLH